MDRIEDNGRLEMSTVWGVPHKTSLTLDEHAMLKMADMLDMWEWGLYEKKLGNQFAVVVSERCQKHIVEGLLPNIDEPNKTRVESYMKRRIREW